MTTVNYIVYILIIQKKSPRLENKRLPKTSIKGLIIMTHFYTLRQLSLKTRTQLWKICDQIGCAKRRSKADCITEILALQPQLKPVQKEVAIIDYDDSLDGLTQPYIIVVKGVLIHRTATYAQAERFCQFQGYNILDAQQQAQSKLLEYMEAQVEDIQIDDYLFHDDPQPRSTEAGTIPQQHNGYFDVASDISCVLSSFDKIVAHGKITMNTPKDIVLKDDWKQKLIYAAELLESVMSDAYNNGLERSDKLFLSKCL